LKCEDSFQKFNKQEIEKIILFVQPEKLLQVTISRRSVINNGKWKIGKWKIGIWGGTINVSV